MNLNRMTDKLGDALDALVGWRPDALMIAGAGGVAYGAWLIHQPSGFIVGGLLAMAAGWLESRSAA
jgi:hypothetical protein